ncbi:MAG: substrate-binding domain-containing protein [Lachnospiraceae bacterium]|nr:substrate-binding domain-containing protein [Lachnospiraceae bacterium]
MFIKVLNKKNKENKESKYTIATILLMVLVILTGLLTVVSMIYFRIKVNNDLNEALEQTKEYDRYYALVVRDTEDPYWSGTYESMKEEGEQTGVYVDKTGSNLLGDYSEAEHMNMAISSGVDGIIYEADESVEATVQINKAIAAGIPVVTVRADAPASARRSFVGVSYYNLGMEYGKLIIEACEDTVNKISEDNEILVLVLTDKNLQDTSQNVVVTALKETVQKNNDIGAEIKVDVADVENSGDFTAEESIRDLFHGRDLPEIIVCLNETNTSIVYQTIVERNKVGETVIFGYDDSPSILDAIRKEVIRATITVNRQQMGKDCVDALNEYIEYKRVSDYYGVDYNIINKDNVGSYAESEAVYER